MQSATVQTFVDILLSFPTVVFTFPLGLAFIYWIFVIVGAFDIESLDMLTGGGDALEGAADGAVEGIAEGAVEGAAEGAAEGVAEGATDGIAEGAAEAADGALDGVADGSLAMVANILRIGKVPVTVSFSLIILLGWVASGAGMSLLWNHLPSGLIGWLLKAAVGAGAFMGSVGLTNLLLRPLEGAFKHDTAARATDFVGQRATLVTSTIDATFGQAELRREGDVLRLHVRCGHDNDLGKGDEVIIIGYDRERNTYEVQPYQALLDELSGRGARPTTDKPAAARAAVLHDGRESKE